MTTDVALEYDPLRGGSLFIKDVRTQKWLTMNDVGMPQLKLFARAVQLLLEDAEKKAPRGVAIVQVVFKDDPADPIHNFVEEYTKGTDAPKQEKE